MMKTLMRNEREERGGILTESKKSLQTFFFLSLLSIIFFPLNSWSDIYSYIDENGTVHFTNVPTDQRYRMFLREKKNYHLGLVDPQKYDPLISEVCEKYNMDAALIKAIIRAESNFDPYVTSWKGAQGLMQLMPETAYELNVNDVFHPRENLEGGVRYMKYLLERFNHNLSLALAAYNAGENAVLKYNLNIPPYNETKEYVSRVLRYFRAYQVNR
jgi:soluble lytic murein transglycosylase-like protein